MPLHACAGRLRCIRLFLITQDMLIARTVKILIGVVRIPAFGILIAVTAMASEMQPGGEGSVRAGTLPAFDLPLANLPESMRPRFYAGKALANQPWIKAPTTTDARDGLGPLYNARTCLACHVRGGKGVMPSDDKSAIFAAVMRLSIPGEIDPLLGVRPEPVYGDQLQGQSVALSHQLRMARTPIAPADNPEAPPEAQVYLAWTETPFTYPDGDTVHLRRPTAEFRDLGYGALHADTQTSLRAAPAIHGMGLLAAVAPEALLALADPEDDDGDGISGKPNYVWSASTSSVALGRFGWKANKATLDDVVAAAFAADVGITSPLAPQQPCSAAQLRCLKMPSGENKEGFELPQDLLELTSYFLRNIGVPKARVRDAQAQQGREVFREMGCAGCHTPSLKTGTFQGELAHLSEQTIWPYTDLLLHDMGAALADDRPDFDASGQEWRTPPLWGLGLSSKVNGVSHLLHDGRARNPEEAILWHGGEAAASTAAFVNAEREEREALIRFLETL